MNTDKKFFLYMLVMVLATIAALSAGIITMAMFNFDNLFLRGLTALLAIIVVDLLIAFIGKRLIYGKSRHNENW